jgi:hypothetical protein
MAVHDELMARLATVGAAAVFDLETLPDSPPNTSAPYLILQEISAVPDLPIDGGILGTEERWQVSVRGAKLHAVRTMAQAVISSLHMFTSATIKLCEYESWPGTIAEGAGSTRQFHAPVDFTVKT